MSERRRVILAGPLQRKTAHEYIDAAPDGYSMTLAEPTRNLDQNARMWAMLGEVSKQVVWYGKKLTPEAWKCVFSASLKKQEVIPGLHGDFVVIGQKTSRMTVGEMSGMIELMFAFGAEQGVKFEESSHE